MIVDVARCVNCQNCTMATKDEYVGNDIPGYTAPQPHFGHEWLTIDRHVRGNGSMVDVTYVPRMCNHCDNAPCVKAGGGAVYKRPDGIVIIDPVKAKGRKNIVSSCPYRNIWWNEELQLPQQWLFDAHLLDRGWKEPRCSQACPTGALRALKVSDEELAAIVRDEGLTVISETLSATRPRVLYKNLALANREFIGGNVVHAAADGCVDNVHGADVELASADGKVAQRVHTDHYGDFKFDGLEGAGAAYSLRISHPMYGDASIDVTLAESRYLGSIRLGQPPAAAR
jgi:Fe-S-cluster-containing dehydrogenase component